MSELAYNVTGDRFEPPASASFWRVRRLKPGGRGTPDVVFGPDGAPLMLPIDAELADFRGAVKNAPGRYRLDPVDETYKSCEEGCPAYLCIDDTPDAGGHQAAAAPNHDVIRELVRANTEMVRSIADKFSAVMDSAAALIRAADGAGLPAREPSQLPPHIAAALRNAAPENDEGDEDEDDLEPSSEVGKIIKSLSEQFGPVLSHTINTKFLGLTTEQSVALMGGGAVPVTANEAPPTTKKEEPAQRKRAATPPDFMKHLRAIQALLTPEESRLAQAAIAKMPPAAMQAWRERLLAMTAKDAAAAIRAEIEQMSQKKNEAAQEAGGETEGEE